MTSRVISSVQPAERRPEICLSRPHRAFSPRGSRHLLSVLLLRLDRDDDQRGMSCLVKRFRQAFSLCSGDRDDCPRIFLQLPAAWIWSPPPHPPGRYQELSSRGADHYHWPSLDNPHT